jgi:hypothetical protein
MRFPVVLPTRLAGRTRSAETSPNLLGSCSFCPSLRPPRHLVGATVRGEATATHRPTPHRRTHRARRTTSSSVNRDSRGRIGRSSAAKHAFERQQPCASIGRSSGACPGYVVDHVRPLECGGADAPSNMQWQTIAASKAKDKTEGKCR